MSASSGDDLCATGRSSSYHDATASSPAVTPAMPQGPPPPPSYSDVFEPISAAPNIGADGLGPGLFFSEDEFAAIAPPSNHVAQQPPMYPPPSAPPAFDATTHTAAQSPPPQQPLPNLVPPTVPRATAPVYNVPYQGQQSPRLFDGPSTATLIRGQTSMDPMLNNAEDIMHFFRTHNTEPVVHLVATGSHQESHTDSNGNTTTRTVTDFSTTMELNHLVCPYGYMQVQKKAAEKAVRAAVKAREKIAAEKLGTEDNGVPPEGASPIDMIVWNYIQCESWKKQLTMIKTVDWNWDEICRAIKDKLRKVYRHQITVRPVWKNAKVVIKAPTFCNRMSNDPLVKVFCLVTCLCLLYRPYVACIKDNHNMLQSHFRMAVTTDQFLHYNLQLFNPYGFNKIQPHPDLLARYQQADTSAIPKPGPKIATAES